MTKTKKDLVVQHSPSQILSILQFSMHFRKSSFQRSCWSCHADLSASIIKTPFYMSANFINDRIAKISASFLGHSKCQANLCSYMISSSAWCPEAIIYEFFFYSFWKRFVDVDSKTGRNISFLLFRIYHSEINHRL